MTPYWEYHLEVEIDSDDVGTLCDALPDERLVLTDLLGWDELERRIRSGRLVYDVRHDGRLPEIEEDVRVFSIYLSQYIVAREYQVEPTQGAPVLRGWKIVGRLGETARLELDLAWDVRAQAVVDRDEDVRAAARRWADLPPWLQDALRTKHPRLQAL